MLLEGIARSEGYVNDDEMKLKQPRWIYDDEY